MILPKVRTVLTWNGERRGVAKDGTLGDERCLQGSNS